MELGSFSESRNFNAISEKNLSVFSELPESCQDCKRHVSREEFINNLLVCPHCSFHHRLNGKQRLAVLVDERSFVEVDQNFSFTNPIGLEGYEKKYVASRAKVEISEAVLTGQATISGLPCVLGIMDFAFFGGSMGSVVGEKITRIILRGADRAMPVILVTASGGARMQEGIFSLMQMAKTAHAVALLDELCIPLIVVLTHPTMGGVTASFAMLGDITLAEKGALVGFAGARVIEGTIKDKLPPGFQSAEFQQQHGFVDKVVDRRALHEVLVFLLHTHQKTL